MAKIPPDEDYTYDLSRNAAAKLLGVAPRTIGRMVAGGELEKDPDTGLFSREQIDEILCEEDGKDVDHRDVIVKELTAAFIQSTGHNERLLKLLEGPIQTALTTVTAINQNLLKQIEADGEAKLDLMKVVGDFLYQKDERAALAKEAEQKAENVKTGLKMLEKATPVLLSQMAGTKPLHAFFEKLTPDEKTGIADLANYLDSKEKRDMFEALLTSVGVKVPPKGGEPTNDSLPIDVLDAAQEKENS